MSQDALYRMKVVDFIKNGVFPNVHVSWFQAKRDGFTVYRDEKRCGKCGLKTWRAISGGYCINCRMIKEGYVLQFGKYTKKPIGGITR